MCLCMFGKPVLLLSLHGPGQLGLQLILTLLLLLQAPEMVRVPLEELVLQIHLLGLGPAGQFLDRVLEPPPQASVEGALNQLQALGALTNHQQLTPLGMWQCSPRPILLTPADFACIVPKLCSGQSLLCRMMHRRAQRSQFWKGVFTSAATVLRASVSSNNALWQTSLDMIGPNRARLFMPLPLTSPVYFATGPTATVKGMGKRGVVQAGACPRWSVKVICSKQ